MASTPLQRGPQERDLVYLPASQRHLEDVPPATSSFLLFG